MVNKTHKLAENVFLLKALYLYVLSKYRIILLQMAAFINQILQLGKLNLLNVKFNRSINLLIKANFSTVRIFSL